MGLHHLVFLLLLPVAWTTICKQTSDELSFSTSEIADEDYVRRGMYLEIYCCANKFVGDIEWSHRVDGALVKFPPPGNNETYKFEQRGQLLKIPKTEMKDNGTFVCTARNGGESVTFHFTLHVLECPQAAGKVTPLKVPAYKEYASIGDSLSLECLGDFGCGMISFRRAFWMADNHPLRDRETDYYSITKINKSDGMIMGSILTFKQVTPENFTTNFTCVLAPPQPNVEYFPVDLIRKETTEELPPWLLPLLVAMGVVLILCGLATALVFPRRHQAEYWIKSKLNIGWPKNCVDKKIGLLSSEESSRFVTNNIYSHLKDSYDTYYNQEQSLDLGRAEAAAHLENLQTCSHVVMYMSHEEGEEAFSRFFINVVPKIREASKIIIIHDGTVKAALQSLDEDTRQRLKIVKKFLWPKDADANSRKMKEFWCSVKLCLPAMTGRPPIVRDYHRNHSRTSSSSSSSALIQGEAGVEISIT